MSLVKIIKGFGVFAICATSVGCSCAKKADLDDLRSDLKQEIKVVSDQVAEVSINSEQTRHIAEEANKRSQRTEEAVNRGFKKSMRK